jgi:hypothetical protein
MYDPSMNSPKALSGGISEVASKGGIARAKSLTPEERRAIGRHAVAARWEKAGKLKKFPVAIHGSPDRPLRIGELQIPCYVLDDKRRVLTLNGVLGALNMTRGSGEGGEGGNRLARFATGKAVQPFFSESVLGVMRNPLQFRLPKILKGGLAYGYEATLLADICEAVLSARAAGKLMHHQEHIALQCEVLLRGFARVGIVALVDEATGYQYDRPRRDLEEYLKRFISESLIRWARTFPNDYFKHLCRLKGVELRDDMRLPKYFGHLTNDLVYRRIAPGLLKALKDRREERGKASNKLCWWTSEELGHPELLLHLGTVVGLMKINSDYDVFRKQLNQIAPIFPDDPTLFHDPKDWETPNA